MCRPPPFLSTARFLTLPLLYTCRSTSFMSTRGAQGTSWAGRNPKLLLTQPWPIHSRQIIWKPLGLDGCPNSRKQLQKNKQPSQHHRARAFGTNSAQSQPLRRLSCQWLEQCVMMFTCGFLCAIITDLNSSEKLITVNTLSGKLAVTQMGTPLRDGTNSPPRGCSLTFTLCIIYMLQV